MTYDQLRAGVGYTRRVAGALDAPSALRPDGEGLGMGLAELVDALRWDVRDLIATMQENTEEVRGLRADLKRRWEGG